MESSPKSSKNEINTFFGKCRCCLEYGYMKSMWSEYERDGFREIYGEMLMDTFSVAWQSLDESQDYICEACVSRLQDAYDFKKEMLASEQLMYEDLDELDQTSFKVEALDEYEDMVNESAMEDNFEIDKASVSDTEYYEVEYLEDEMDNDTETLNPTTGELETLPKKKKETNSPTKQKSQEKPTRTYKNYCEDDMKQCLDAVRKNQMSVAQAAKLFGVPRKSVFSRITYEQNRKKPVSAEDAQKAAHQEKQHNLIAEIKIVLTFTNALPFKVKASKYFCAYCRECFDDPDDLRIHSRSHEEVWIKNVDRILRPQFLNEILRIDIDNLTCKVCEKPLKTWNDMFIHLKDSHQIDLDQAYTRLVPFKLRREFINCALCDQRFANFAFLDNHMNSHYINYMCSECGDTYLTENRLKHHIQIHNKGKFPCDECGKIFSLEKYMKKHQAMVHKKFKIFKCAYCPERFHGEFERHNHVVEMHNEKIRISTCELCGKTFDWRPYYLAHLRKVHSAVKKFNCSYCSKAFVSRHELKLHEQRHTGSGKYVCSKCSKNFVTMMELRLHVKKHFKEDGFIS